MNSLDALSSLPPYLREAAFQYRLSKVQSLIYDNPADFIEAEMIIPELKAPMTLHDEQRSVLDAMSARDDNGDFKYSTWLFSMPKKSAKTAIGAAVALWQAWRIPDGEIYIIGNDLRQADNRMAQAIRYCIEHNPKMRNRAKISTSAYRIQLDNGTRIESIPVDPRGEAGMNPTGLFWTEAWGAKGQRAELLWSEATLSPTRAGQSFKFVESYAGHIGESLILERLYEGIIKNGGAHDTIPELFTNGQSIGYWCTRRYLPWQQDEAYYRQQALEKTPEEFDRQHNNKWASSSEAFVPAQWWESCKGGLSEFRQYQGVVIALDAAIRDDTFAIIMVSKSDKNCEVRYARAWIAPPNGVIPYAEIEAEIVRLCQTYHVECIAYDEYQLVDMAQRLAHIAWWYKFSQAKERAIADKQLFDMIRDGRIRHNGETQLAEHITNANRKPEDENKLRIVKRSQGQKIDLCVALSMACSRALYLNM